MRNGCKSFVKLEWCVLLDSELSLGARCLYAVIRLRCMNRGYTFAGEAVFSKDLGVNERTVRRYMNELKTRGLVETKRRGLAMTQITQPVGTDVVYPGWELPIRTGVSALLGHQCPHYQDTSVRSEVEEVEVEEEEVDLPASQDPGPKNPEAEVVQGPEADEAVKRMTSVDLAMERARMKTRKAIEDRMRKKKRRSDGRRPDAKKERITAVDVEEWFKDEVRREYGPELRQSKWTLKEKANAKLLLEGYGPELVEKAIQHMVRDWRGLAERIRVTSAVPSIGILTGYRDTIFAEVQVGTVRRKADPMSGEYDEGVAKESPTIGWGDLAKRSGDS